MSSATDRMDPWADPRLERWQSWIATTLSVLLHLLMLLILLYSSKPTMTTEESAAGGARTRVRFIGEPREADRDTPTQQVPPPSASPKRAQPPPARSPVRSTLVDRSDHPVPEPARTLSDSRSTRHHPMREQPDSPPQEQPSNTPPSQSQAREPSDTPSPTARRHPETWTGQPPGLIEQDTAPDNAGLSAGPAVQNGRGRNMTGNAPSMELGGYLVYYDVLSEERLRGWKKLGMREVFFPLPGTRYYMACPIEIALARGSGKCRPLAPDSPELPNIGDAREAITMQRVYRQGELVWSGPGAYR